MRLKSQPKLNLAPPIKDKSQFVNYLAMMLVLLSGAILVVLIVMAWVGTGCTDEDCQAATFDRIKELLGIMLPLIGTWMGTILAFYFSKENFEAANERVKELVDQINPTDQKLHELKAKDVMIKLDTAVLMTVDDLEAFKDKKLNELLDKMQESQSERMPILQTGTLKFIYLIYRTTIERFILEVTKGKVKREPDSNNQTPFPVIDELRVRDMFESDFALIKEIEKCKATFMPVTATLDQVKRAMQDNNICQDVFITKNGNKDEPVEGWITNNLIIEKAELFKKVIDK